MAAMNLSLPDALKAEMDKCEGINWSAVAQQAFRQTVEIEGIKRVNTSQAGLARLRKSRESVASTDRATGFAAGKTWALERAEYQELERVAELESEGPGWEGDPGALGWAYDLVGAVYGDDEWGRSECERFGMTHFGTEHPSAALVQGFIAGATEVFNAV